MNKFNINLIAFSTLFLSHTAMANINFNTIKMDYTPPAYLVDLCQNIMPKRLPHLLKYPNNGTEHNPKTSCMQVDIDLVKTGISWIDYRLNQFYLKSDFKSNLNESAHLTYDFFSETENQDSVMSYQISSHAKLMSSSDKTIQIVREDYQFSFGDHGIPSVKFFALDLANKKQLQLVDIMVNHSQKDKLEQLLKQKFVAKLKEDGYTDVTIQAHFDFWKFFPTDNFFFTPNGITFVYTPYEIAPYSMGFISLTMSNQELSSLVKAKYLNQKFNQFNDHRWNNKANKTQ